MERSMITQGNLWHHLGTLALVVVVVWGTSQGQEAQSSPRDSDGEPRMMSVGGHSFSPSYYVADPFIRTFARNSLGFGLTPNLEMPLVEIGGTQISWNSGQLIYSNLEFELQGALRQWLALNAKVQVIGRVANETIPLISQGIVLVTGYEFGTLFDILHTENLILALSTGATSTGLTDVNIGRFISALIDTGAITPDNDLVTSTPSVRAFAGLRLAYGINDLFGVMVQARLLYGEAPQRQTSDQWFASFAALLDLDLTHRWNAPIGFGIGFKTSSSPAGTRETGQYIFSYIGRISYVGARDFDLGLDIAYELIPVTSLPKKTAFLTAVIDMRLIF